MPNADKLVASCGPNTKTEHTQRVIVNAVDSQVGTNMGRLENQLALIRGLEQQDIACANAELDAAVSLTRIAGKLKIRSGLVRSG